MQQQWLFVSATGQQFTANEPDVPALVQSGQISAQTLMWREGMPQWMPAASVFPLIFAGSSAVTQPMVGSAVTAATAPVAAAASAPAAAPGRPASPTATGALGEAAVRRLAAPLIERKGWIKVLGISCIILGIFSLPFGLLVILSGVALMKMAGHLERVQAGGDFAQLEEAQKNAAKFFFFQGIVVALSLAFLVLAIGLVLITGGAAIFSGLKHGPQVLPGEPGSGGPTIDDIRMPDSPPPSQGQ